MRCPGGWHARNIQFSDKLADESHTFWTKHSRRCLELHTFRSPQSHCSTPSRSLIETHRTSAACCGLAIETSDAPFRASFRLGAGPAVALVTIVTEPAILPSLRGAISLTGNMQQRHERVAAGKTEAGRFHGAPVGSRRSPAAVPTHQRIRWPERK